MSGSMFFGESYLYPTVVDGVIETKKFLEASKGIVKFVELLGTVFTPVKSDIKGNIDKLYAIYNKDEQKCITLNALIEHDLGDPAKVGIDALLWLKRALEYVSVFLNCFVDDYRQGQCSEDLSAYFHKAYEEKLKMYHGWFVQKLFGLMVMATPSRKDLLRMLSCGNEITTEAEILKDVENFVESLNNNLNIINELYRNYNLDSTAIV